MTLAWGEYASHKLPRSDVVAGLICIHFLAAKYLLKAELWMESKIREAI